MVSSSQPWRNQGDNSWGKFIDKINDFLQDPPDGCDPIDIIEKPDECHRWSKSDIREVHDKLNEMPGDCFDFDDVPDIWKVSIIDDVEDQLTEVWCECNADCPNVADEEKIFLISVFFDDTDCVLKAEFDFVADEAARDDFNDAVFVYRIAKSNYHQGLFPKVCQLEDELEALEEELEDLQDELASLNKSKDATCGEDPLGSSCVSLTAQVSDKEKEIDEIEEEIDEKQEELNTLIKERDAVKKVYIESGQKMLASHKERTALRTGSGAACISFVEGFSFPAPAQCRSPFTCRVGWAVQIRTNRTGGQNTPGFGGWGGILGGEWDVEGNIVPTSNKACRIADRFCTELGFPGPDNCEPFTGGIGTVGSICGKPDETVTHEYRLVIRFPEERFMDNEP